MIKDITITSLETITAFDVATGNYKFTLDELQKATIANSEEKVEITGKGGRKLANLKKNKGVVISGTHGLVSGGLLELQTGGEFEEKATEVLWTDYLVVDSAKATTTYTAVGTTGNEIESVYVKNSDGVVVKTLTQGATASADIFKYTPSSKELEFSGLENGTEIVVHYKRKIQANVLENKSDVYSGKCTLYVDAMGEDMCSNVYRIQFFIPKADFNGEFSIELGDSQTVHDFEAESLVGSCGLGDSLWTYTVFGVNAADAT